MAGPQRNIFRVRKIQQGNHRCPAAPDNRFSHTIKGMQVQRFTFGSTAEVFCRFFADQTYGKTTKPEHVQTGEEKDATVQRKQGMVKMT